MRIDLARISTLAESPELQLEKLRERAVRGSWSRRPPALAPIGRS
jgi:hypothetical protein